MRSDDSGINKTSRRDFVLTAAAGLVAIALFKDAKGEIVTHLDGDPYPELVEVTIAELQAQMKAKKLTSRKLTEMYLARIAAIDPKTHAVLIDAAVVHARLMNLDRTDAAENRPRLVVAVAHHQAAIRSIDLVLVRLDVLGDLVLDRLMKCPAGSLAGDLLQSEIHDRLGCQPQSKSG